MSIVRPSLVIVGRPNVGKSTLFNRLIGRRRAITDPTPGVTRDPVVVTATVGSREMRVVDTGGYTTESDDMAKAISERALAEIRRADVILFVVDATELTGLDEIFLAVLRAFDAKVVLVVNKIDTTDRDELIWDFYRFGLSRVVAVSSAHGRGVEELVQQIDAILGDIPAADDGEQPEEPGDDSGPPEDASISVAVLGQPNTGKSTLVNRLTGTEGSLVSSIPGTTRDVIEGAFAYKGTNYRILDTAGIRRKSKVTENIEYYSVTRAIDTIEEAEVVVLLVDAEKGLSDQDKKIAALVVDRGRGLVVGLNKWDLLPQIANQFEAVRDRIHFSFPVIAFAPVIALSAQNGKGIPDLLGEIARVRRQLHHRVDTGKLNRHLADWIERTPPPMRGSRRLKVRYVTQVQRLPVTFIAFVSHRKGFPDSYVSYLQNQIRADFGLSSIPFRLELRER